MENTDITQDNQTGISSETARIKLKTEGFNELPSVRERKLIEILFSVLKEPMLALLVGAGVIYLILGEPKDTFLLSTFIIFVVGITIYQERKTEKAIKALKRLSSPRALVIRDGVQIRIPGREVVTGDTVVIREGDRIPADAYVTEQNNLSVDESILTGESKPVNKTIWDGIGKDIRPGGNNLPTVYSGTLVVTGKAVISVFATGINTQMGKIGKSLSDITDEEALIHKETRRIVRLFTLVGGVMCIFLILVWGVTKGDWLGGILSGLSLSMSLLPEEFPVVLTIFFALGAWRLSKRQVLVRHVAAVETLGATTVLCVDKTGTLTANKMELTEVLLAGDENPVPIDPIQVNGLTGGLLKIALLASDAEAFDPLDREIKKQALKQTSALNLSVLGLTKIRDYPMRKDFIAVTYAWQKENGEIIITAKGAPEEIIGVCKLDENEKSRISKIILDMANRGLRVLGVAEANPGSQELVDDQKSYPFKFSGLLGFSDPVRTTVPDAVSECYQAGIRIIIVTGDYPGTAQSVAKQIGLKNSGQYITGDQLEVMNQAELREKIKTVNIFARVLPEQKLLIVNALKSNHEIVAMTGDGVNDAPALKSANIGISMGERGTDVAREASDIVLLNDDFSSIVKAVRTGRKIYGNLKKAMAFIFAVHVPIAGLTIFPVVLGTPIILLPAHIAFLELIIDPACSTVFESEHSEAGIMKDKPRNLKEPMFGRPLLILSFLQGASVLSVTLILYLLSLYHRMTPEETRTVVFVALVSAYLALIITNLSWKKLGIRILSQASPALRIILTLVILALSGSLFIPLLRTIFHFSVLNWQDLMTSIIAGGISLGWFELFKLITNNRKI
jgi:Ca2+-transporting ATPase